MSASLILRNAADVGNPVGNLNLRYVNVVNTPIVSATFMDSGAEVADVYVLTFTVSGGVSCVLSGLNAKNPQYNRTVTGLVADGSTPNTDLVRGVSIVLSASLATGWQAKLSIGAKMDGSGNVTQILDLDVVQAGTNTAGARVAAENIGDAPAQNCAAYALPGLTYSGTGYDTIIKKIAPHSETARHKMASTGTLVLTFANWATGGGGKKIADVKVGGVTCITGAIFDGTTVYQYGSGNGYNDSTDLLAGLQLILANTTVDPTGMTITVVVSADYTWWQFAPDSSGSPGTYANQDLTLTEAGQTTGTILAGGAAFFWVRAAVPSAAAAGAMRMELPRLRGLTT
jgi:hypothetical protein